MAFPYPASKIGAVMITVRGYCYFQTPMMYTAPSGYPFQGFETSLDMIRYSHDKIAEYGIPWARESIATPDMWRIMLFEHTTESTALDFSQINDWQAVDLAVRQAHAHGTKLILFFDYALGLGLDPFRNPAVTPQRWIDGYVIPFATAVAQRYKDYYDTIILEPINEIDGEPLTLDQKVQFQEAVYDTIKTNCYAAPNDLKVSTPSTTNSDDLISLLNRMHALGVQSKFDAANVHLGYFRFSEPEDWEVHESVTAINTALATIGRSDAKILIGENTPHEYGNAYSQVLDMWNDLGGNVAMAAPWQAWGISNLLHRGKPYTDPSQTLPELWPYRYIFQGDGYPPSCGNMDDKGHSLWILDTGAGDATETAFVAAIEALNLPGKGAAPALVSVAYQDYSNRSLLHIDYPAGTTAHYRINGGEWSVYATPVTVENEDVVEHYADDGVDTEATRTFVAMVPTGTSGNFSLPSVSLQPVVSASSLAAFVPASFTMPSLQVQPVIIPPTLAALSASGHSIRSPSGELLDIRTIDGVPIQIGIL